MFPVCCLLVGHVAAVSGRPVAGARVELQGRKNAWTASDASGTFSIEVASGSYRVHVAARGFAQAFAGPIAIDGDTRLDVTLQPLDTSQLRVISQIRVNGSLALQREAVPNVDVTREQMQELGESRIVTALQQVPSVTFARPDGGAASAPSVVALRGPDPSETLVTLDGQVLNDANTGDLDLSRFPVAAFSNVDLTEGLGPTDSEGSSTIGGAVNLISLQPTQTPHEALSLSDGSFGSSQVWYNATNTTGKLGYALALDDQQERGYVPGSAVSSRALLVNAGWSFSQQADVRVRIFSLGDDRDESSTLNRPATFGQSVRAYALTGRTPLGAGTLVYDASASDDDVAFAGTPGSPYDLTHRDKRGTFSLTWQRDFADGDIALGAYTRGETFGSDGVAGRLAQAIQSYFVRAALDPQPRLHLQAGLYASRYSTFGSNLDGRIGADYDLSRDSVLRASAGTGFRAPLLIERYLFDIDQLALDQNCVAVGQGNPNERPEHATEYELGYGRHFRSHANLDVSLYRTNLRDPIEVFYPLGSTCPATNPPPQSYPINVGNAVYQGAELRYTQHLGDFTLSADYGLNVAYPLNMPPSVANPTSGGDLVAHQQFLNIPQQEGSLEVTWKRAAWRAAIDTAIRGSNNELNQGPFAIANAAVGRAFGDADLMLAGTNLTNAVAGGYTQIGMGVPYPGIAGPLPTNRFFIEPAGVRVILTLRR